MDSKQGDQQCEARLQTDTKIQEQGDMCDSGLVIVVLLTSFFVLVALQSIFYSFDYNCNNFYYDDVVGGGIHDPTPTNLCFSCQVDPQCRVNRTEKVNGEEISKGIKGE